MIEDAEAGNEYGLKAIAQAPKVDDRFAYYSWAYRELGDERTSLGMSIGPIPRSAVNRFCEEEGLDPLESDALMYVVRTVDRHERRKAAEKARAEQDRASNISKRNR